jgi:hypothetical protein
VAAVLAGVCIAPWTYRNYLVFERIVPVSGNFGIAYLAGVTHWEGKDGFVYRESNVADQAAVLEILGIELEHDENGAVPFKDVDKYIDFWGTTDVELDQKADRMAIADMRDRPGAFAKKIAINGAEFYFPVAYVIYGAMHGVELPSVALLSTRSIPYLAGVSLYFLVLWILALRGRRLSLMLLIAAYVAPFLPFLSYSPHAQYAFPTIPLLACMIALGLSGRRESESARTI